MSKRESLSRYSLIINKLRKSPATLQEIQDYLKRESELQDYNFTVSGRTFQRDLADIRSLYNIDVNFDFSAKVYKINNPDETEINNRMLEAFDIFQALNLSEGLSKYIHFEKRKPQGTENLFGLLHATKNHLLVKFTYHKFWDNESSERKLEPYALKEFKNRWYILGKDLADDQIKTFGLDRLSNLEITAKKFSYPKDYNVDNHFENCFGIISPNGKKIEMILLSFDSHQGKYIKTMPLHHSQKVIFEDNSELQISLKLCITQDFVMELLSHGNRVKVLRPTSLIDELENIYKEATKHCT